MSRHKKKKGELKKKELKSVLWNTVLDCMYLFGYKRIPGLIETKLDEGSLMAFVAKQHCKDCAILFDYEQLYRKLKSYNKKDRKYQIAYVTAHEMRHYYQFRRSNGFNKNEDEKMIKAWKNKSLLKKDMGQYYGNAKELDAFTFAYVYVANRFGVIVGDVGVPVGYRKAMKSHCKKLYKGEDKIFLKKYDKYFW